MFMRRYSESKSSKRNRIPRGSNRIIKRDKSKENKVCHATQCLKYNEKELGNCIYAFSKCDSREYFESKTMGNKVIFESEEEAIEKLHRIVPEVCFKVVKEKHDIDLMEFMITTCKDYGYIHKSIVEEAEEYEKHVAETMDKGLSASIKDLEWSIRIIIGLEAEIGRLKKLE